MGESVVRDEISKLPIQFDAVALDIGAHHGAYTRLLADKFEHVYAFEMDEANFQKLTTNIKTENKENVTLIQKAIGIHTGTARYYPSSKNKGGHTTSVNVAKNSSWGHDPKVSVGIEMITIDDFCKDLKNIKFIKCDIEGAEDRVFEHAINTLKNHDPIIALETHGVVDHSGLATLFSTLGYLIYNGTGHEVFTFEKNQHYIIRKKK